MRSRHRPGNFLNIGERGVAGRRSCRHDAQSAPTSRGLAPERDGGGDGSEVIGGLSKDARGAIHEFIFPSLVRVIHLQSQRIDTLMRSNHVQTCVFVFFLKLGRVVVFWRRHRRLL